MTRIRTYRPRSHRIAALALTNGVSFETQALALVNSVLSRWSDAP